MVRLVLLVPLVHFVGLVCSCILSSKRAMRQKRRNMGLRVTDSGRFSKGSNLRLTLLGAYVGVTPPPPWKFPGSRL